jgi:two-component system LytT family response regulator
MMAPVSFVVVDDDRIDRLTLLAFLRNYPFMANKGDFSAPEAALASIQAQPPDVLFLDIDMPGQTGLPEQWRGWKNICSSAAGANS